MPTHTYTYIRNICALAVCVCVLLPLPRNAVGCCQTLPVIFMTFPMNTKCLIKCRSQWLLLLLLDEHKLPSNVAEWMMRGRSFATASGPCLCLLPLPAASAATAPSVCRPKLLHSRLPACDDTHNLFNFHVSVCVSPSVCMCVCVRVCVLLLCVGSR